MIVGKTHAVALSAFDAQERRELVISVRHNDVDSPNKWIVALGYGENWYLMSSHATPQAAATAADAIMGSTGVPVQYCPRFVKSVLVYSRLDSRT